MSAAHTAVTRRKQRGGRTVDADAFARRSPSATEEAKQRLTVNIRHHPKRRAAPLSSPCRGACLPAAAEAAWTAVSPHSEGCWPWSPTYDIFGM